MLKKTCLGLLTLFFVSFIFAYFTYAGFRDKQLEILLSNSQVAETSVGPIEYRLVGDYGPMVLFLHGTPGGYDQIDELPGIRILAPSRPGYLRTPLTVGKSPAEQAHAYAALLDVLNIDSVVVMGASGGGPSSISFAAMYPERTSALIAMEAVSQIIPSNEGAPEMPVFMRSDFLMWVTLSTMENFLDAKAIVKILVPDEAIQDLILSDAKKTARVKSLIWSAWPISQRETGQANDISQFAMLDLASREVTVPTLIIHGDRDINVPFRHSDMLARQIPGSILHVVEGGDHMMPFSHSEEVDMAMERFLKKHNIE